MSVFERDAAAASIGMRVARALASEDPKTNVTAIRMALDGFLAWRGQDGKAVPTKAELSAYLVERITKHGLGQAGTDFSYLQIAAARLWGTAETAHFAIVLREARVTKKAPRMDDWTRARRAMARLPEMWRVAFERRISWPQPTGGENGGDIVWSPSRVEAVAAALTRWHEFCMAHEQPFQPTGATLETFAYWSASATEKGAAERTVADYIGRILTGFAHIISPGFTSPACDFVLRDRRERAGRAGSPTKTGAQLVSASAIYDLGFAHMDRARGRRTRGMRAALDFRNGILLAVAIALPQRARALSVLELGQTISLIDGQHLQIRIPARYLKLPEAEKDGSPFETRLRNPDLAAALLEYARDYRPIFDSGGQLFPSFHAQGVSISEKRLGQLAGTLTHAEFGTRISIHRFRDNVATELSDTVKGGGRMVSGLLGHKSRETAAKHYERSDGLKAAKVFGDLVEARRARPEKLLL